MPATATAETLATLIEERRQRRLVSEARVYRQDHPRASNIGDCDREIYHQIINWQQRPAPEPWLKARFEEGIRQERAVVRELSDLGFDVTEAQRPFEIRDRDGLLLCTGHTDGLIEAVVFEVKSLNTNVYQRIESASDFNRFPWAKRYPRQLLLYEYAYDKPEGMFLLTDCLGHWRMLPLRLEEYLGQVEALLRRLRAVVTAVAAKDLDRLNFCDDPGICAQCWARTAGLCHPPLDFSGEGLVTVTDQESIDLLDLLAEIDEYLGGASASVDEYEHITATLKDKKFKPRGPGQYLAGNWLVMVTESPRAAYNVPPEVRDKYKTRGSVVKVTWRRNETDQTQTKEEPNHD